MATILKFNASARIADAAPPRRPRARQSAEIVIFPGVRYEYWQEPEQDAPAVKRDRLEPGQ